MAIALDGATTVIINVNVDSCAGSVCAFTLPSSVNFANPTSYADRVMWNFVNATGITFSNEFGGSVLALGAAVTNNGPIDGTLVAASYQGNGELHNYSFAGTLPGPAPAPEPAGLAVLVAGLAGLCAVRRRKR